LRDRLRALGYLDPADFLSSIVTDKREARELRIQAAGLLMPYQYSKLGKTLVGDVTFGAQGEWAESRVLQVQFQHVKGNDVGQFRDLSTQVVITPAPYKSGEMIYPYEKAK
jgi:hypothetical protein